MPFQAEIDKDVEPLVKLIGEDRNVGLKRLRELADTGHKSAVLYLGLYLSEKAETTDESIKWLLKASEFESSEAAWNLAMIARERDQTDEMKRWIDRAAHLGEQDAKSAQQNGYNIKAVLAR